MNTYIKQFQQLTCKQEIIDNILPINNFKKEISESMSIIKHIRKIVLHNKNIHYTILDMCSGNALTSVLSSLLFKNVTSIAIDNLQRDRNWYAINRFFYINKSIYDKQFFKSIISKNTIIIGIHACTHLSKQIINIFKNSSAQHLILMPCCADEYYIPKFIKQRIGNYLGWCMHLANICEGKLIQDNKIISPKNCIITKDK